MRGVGELPFPVRAQGRQWVTTSAQILESLDLPVSPGVAVDTGGQLSA
jgi:hypothetical protein